MRTFLPTRVPLVNMSKVNFVSKADYYILTYYSSAYSLKVVKWWFCFFIFFDWLVLDLTSLRCSKFNFLTIM